MDLKSLRARFSILFGVTLTLVLMSLAGTLGLTVLNRNAASAINISGTLRMQIYRLDAVMLHPRTFARRRLVRELESKLDQTLNSPIIRQSVENDFSGRANRTYRVLLKTWRTRGEPFVRLYLDSPDWQRAARGYDSQAAPLMQRANQLVQALQYSATAWNRLVLWILIAALLLLTFGALLFIALLRHQILTPLQNLLHGMSIIKSGNMTHIPENGASEMRLLIRQFNKMLSLFYARNLQLRTEVEANVRDLTRQNRLLNLSYGVERILSNRDSTHLANYKRSLQLAERMLGLDQVTLCIANSEKDHALPLASRGNPDSDWHSFCDSDDCKSCLNANSEILYDRETATYNIKVGDSHLGVLKVRLQQGRELNEFQQTALESFAVRLGSDIASSRREIMAREQEILEERIAFGRDLHDSLAQTLAYLPIQTLRLRHAMAGLPARPEIKDPALARDALRELDRAITTASHQIRNLITVFRIPPTGDEFSISLIRLCDKFTSKKLAVSLSNEIPDDLLNANEHVHLLHIAHEALSNIVKHASADHAKLNVRFITGRKILLTIEDNGCGFDPEKALNEKHRHFGIVVMKERATALGGCMHVEKREPKGTCVMLHFRPRRYTFHNAASLAIPPA